MLISIQRAGEISIAEQIVGQVANLINSGALKAGDHLPSTRELAKSLGVNRTTIVNAYEELWVQGYVESSPGSYTTVRDRQPVIHEGEVGDSDGVNTEIYRHQLSLLYDPIFEFIENESSLEKGKINFLQLSPDTRLLDPKHIRSSIYQVLNDPETNPFNFTHARGYPPLRREIMKQMQLHNVHTTDRNILVTNGSLQSLQLIFQVFSKPGDCIAVENPTYSIMLMIAGVFGLNVIGIPMKEDGMDLAKLGNLMQSTRPRFIYLMPTYQNPTGISMPQNRREELLKMCASTDCILVEDSIEEEMKYSGKAYLPLKSIDHNGQVIYLGTFTKVMAPGLRIGWIVATEECIKKLTVLKSVFEISSATLNQMFLHRFLKSGAFDLHLRKTLRVFRKRMKIAADAIKKYIPSHKVEWTEPHGGYMIWMKLLTRPVKQIEKHFSSYGVLVQNGQYFFTEMPEHNYIRICIARTNETEIEEGIRRIGEAIQALGE